MLRTPSTIYNTIFFFWEWDEKNQHVSHVRKGKNYTVGESLSLEGETARIIRNNNNNNNNIK